MITNHELRQRARQIIKPNLQVLLLIALIVSLPSLLSNVVTVLSGNNLLSMYQQNLDTSMTVEQLLAVTESYVSSSVWMAMFLSIAQVVLTPVLTLGFINALLTLLRGGTVGVATVFSRMRAFGRSLLLTLLLSLKLFLWTLPGMAIMIVGAFLGENGFLAAFIGSVVMLILVLMAVYRYALAIYFLADVPTTGPRVCIRQSKEVMKNRKWQLFSLELPYYAANYAIYTLISLVIPGVIGTTLSLMAQLIFMVYIEGTQCAFFEHHVHPENAVSPDSEKDPDQDEMKDYLN